MIFAYSILFTSEALFFFLKFLVCFTSIMGGMVKIDQVLMDGTNCYNMDAFLSRLGAAEVRFMCKLLPTLDITCLLLSRDWGDHMYRYLQIVSVSECLILNSKARLEINSLEF